jgi:hypothetical protein
MLALLDRKGNPIPETAICADRHWSKSYTEIRRHASHMNADWDGIDFVDCTHHAALKCVVCGTTTTERSKP